MAKKKVDIKPLDDRVLVEQCEAEEKTAGGIVLPDAARERPQRGIIRAVGPGRVLDSGDRGGMSVKVGDEVFYSKYAGTEVEVDGEKMQIMRESDILAVLEK